MPGVVESAVIGVPDEMYGEVPRAYVVKMKAPASRRRTLSRIAKSACPTINS
ncbi:hypothetical protein PO124_12430 [Bacillus licheniformis]|nr:hypothetical protein [Bacillus licheniformis]